MITILPGFLAGLLRKNVAIETRMETFLLLSNLGPIASASTARSVPSLPGPDASIRLVPPTWPNRVSNSGTTRFGWAGIDEGLPNPVAKRHHLLPLRMDAMEVPFFPMPSRNPANGIGTLPKGSKKEPAH